MSVILLILKIIGILLLALLGIIILLVALVLFVPVRYQVSGELEEEIKVRGRISWLLRLVSWSFAYEKGEFTTGKLRICGIPFKMKEKAKEAEEDAEDETADAEDETADAEDETADAEDETADAEETEIQKEILNSADEDAGNVPGDVLDSAGADTVEQDSEKGKARDVFFQIKNNASDIKKQITDETNRKAVLSVLSELKYMLQRFGFRKIDTNLTFSLGDPAMTGQVLGVLSMLPFLYQYSVRIYPDFETESAYVKGTFGIGGRIQLIYVLVSLVRLLTKEEVRILMNRIRKK